MAKKTATFSNGETVTYKGKRDVQAAWMITEKATGKIVATGFSMDSMKAEKTAKGQPFMRVDGMLPQTRWGNMVAIKKGYRRVSEHNEDVKRCNAEYAKNFKIEVVKVD